MSKLQKEGVHVPSFLHFENLCAQVLDIYHVMIIVVKTVNAIKHNSLKHHQFQQYFQELESEYDVLYFSKIQWLSHGKCSVQLGNLKEKIKNFMKENCSDVSELDDNQGLLDLCFLADIMKQLNELNLKLQEREKFITDCYEI